MTVSNAVIRVPCIKKDAEQVWHGTDDDVARLEKKEHKAFCIFAELSRNLRAGLIHAFWYSEGRQILIWTKSLKKRGALQKTTLLRNKNDINALMDEQIESYEDVKNCVNYGTTIHVM